VAPLAIRYHFGTGSGSVHRHASRADADLGSGGGPDAVLLDFDGDGRVDDALWDVDADGVADRAVLDLDDDGRPDHAYTDPSGRGLWDARAPLDALAAVAAAASGGALPVHLDGARLFNAEVATGVGAAARAGHATTVMCCLSKGLCAPVGSLLAGPADLMAEARGERQRLGGGMRQAGVLAAAGLIALEDTPRRLAADHANARFMAEALGRVPGIQVDLSTVQTNIVIFDVSGTGLAPSEFSARLKQRGVLSNGINARQMRLVTHYDADRRACEQALAAIEEVASAPVVQRAAG
jgi:hypothetical protein